MHMNLQPTHLKNELVWLEPLKQAHFEELYLVASDPLIWEQHPNPDRYKLDAFTNYFKGAMESGGAFIIRDASSGIALGSSRYCAYNEANKEIQIGYTFFARSCWGKSINKVVKALMLSHAFNFVDKVAFYVGANNIRSQKAMERIGGIKVREEVVAYFGEPDRLNFRYEINK
ncbi:MAG: GNAT family N-acetyltransferase [Bacteroidetes bacterium]|nr:GNAT family N-acetyltransferase [Bacteroidota bacterium]